MSTASQAEKKIIPLFQASLPSADSPVRSRYALYTNQKQAFWALFFQRNFNHFKTAKKPPCFFTNMPIFIKLH